MHSKITNRLLRETKPCEKVIEIFDTEIRGFILRTEPSGSQTYYFAYTNKIGRRRRFKIGRQGNVTVIQARDLAENTAARVVTGIDIQAERATFRESGVSSYLHTLKGFIEEKYEPWVLLERKSGKKTLHRIKTKFEEFMKYPLIDITPWIITRWRMRRLKDGIAKTTVNRDVAVLRALLSKAVEWGVIEYHPLAALKPLRTDPNAIIRYLTDDEEKRLRNKLAERDKELKVNRESLPI